MTFKPLFLDAPPIFARFHKRSPTQQNTKDGETRIENRRRDFGSPTWKRCAGEHRPQQAHDVPHSRRAAPARRRRVTSNSSLPHLSPSPSVSSNKTTTTLLQPRTQPPRANPGSKSSPPSPSPSVKASRPSASEQKRRPVRTASPARSRRGTQIRMRREKKRTWRRWMRRHCRRSSCLRGCFLPTSRLVVRRRRQSLFSRSLPQKRWLLPRARRKGRARRRCWHLFPRCTGFGGGSERGHVVAAAAGTGEGARAQRYGYAVAAAGWFECEWTMDV